MKKNLPIIIVLVFLITGFFLIYHSTKHFDPSTIKSIDIAGPKGNIDVKVELALTSAAQQQGLSGRTGLAENTGMLFVFDHPDKYLFWMKDMNFPIDMIWITEDMHVLYIKNNAQPEKFLETYGPEANAKYVLEVNSGFSDKNGLKVGDMVRFGF